MLLPWGKGQGGRRERMRRESEETWRGGQGEKLGRSHHIATNLLAYVYVYGCMTKFAQLYREKAEELIMQPLAQRDYTTRWYEMMQSATSEPKPYSTEHTIA